MTSRGHLRSVSPAEPTPRAEPAPPKPRREDDRPRPPFNPGTIRSGVDACLAALAQAKAVKSGMDPDEAAEIAEGEAAVRRLVLAIRCPHCKAPAGRPCLRVGSGVGDRAGDLPGYHRSRVDAAHNTQWENA